MNSIFASSIILLSLLLFGSSLIYGRKEPAGDYWRSVMKDNPMPKSLKDLFQQDNETKVEHFVKNFDTRSSAIIYHSISKSMPTDQNPQQLEQQEKSIKPEQPEVSIYSHKELKNK